MIVFNIKKKYEYKKDIKFSEFMKDWFFGWKQPDMIPIYEIKKRKRGWIKNNGHTQYAKFYKLADVLRRAFGDDVKHYITTIDDIVMIACDISDDVHIKKAFSTVGKLASFLLGTSSGNAKVC